MKKFVLIFAVVLMVFVTGVSAAELVVIDQEVLNKFTAVAYGESEKIEDGTFIYDNAVYTIVIYGGMDSNVIFGFDYGFQGTEQDMERLGKKMIVYAKEKENAVIDEIEISLVAKNTEYTDDSMYLIHIKSEQNLLKDHDGEYFEYFILTRIY